MSKGEKSVERDEPPDTREPYESPRLESEQLFEVLALACGKINPNQFNCRQLPQNS